MARLFDDAQNENLSVDQPVLSAYPVAMSAWGYSDSAAVDGTLLWLGKSDVGTQAVGILMRGSQGGDPVSAWNRSVAAPLEADSTPGGYSANTWHHVCGLFPDEDNVRVLLDGGNKATNSGAYTDQSATWNRTTIGQWADSSPDREFSGRIAEAAIWDLTNWPGATASDKADSFEAIAVSGLAAGWSPMVFPLGLAAYWPLGGLKTSEVVFGTARDIWGGFDLTAASDDSGGPEVADHPGGLIYPSGALVVPAAVAAAPGGKPFEYYRRLTLAGGA